MAQYLDKSGLTYFWNKAKTAFAPISSPTLTGTPKATTAATTDDSTRIATTAWVRDYIESLNGDGVSY